MESVVDPIAASIAASLLAKGITRTARVGYDFVKSLVDKEDQSKESIAQAVGNEFPEASVEHTALITEIVVELLAKYGIGPDAQTAETIGGQSHIQQAIAKNGGTVNQTIQSILPAEQQQPLLLGVTGKVSGSRITLSVTNTDSIAHRYRARLHAVEGGVGDSPHLEKWLPRWLRWDGASDSELDVAAPAGSTVNDTGSSSNIQFHCIGVTPNEARRLYTRAPWGGQISCDIEIQSDVRIQPEHRNWILTLDDNGDPAAFNPATPRVAGS